ncbi:MAG TPA: hypothetical protein VGS00_01455 [Thermoanaerobaculia bacterium]|nr:hypothetical protein [Thermoanaerobaculia bacterium]
MSPRRWIEFAVSIALGHALYSLVLFPGLRHQPMRFDTGLLTDFALCVLVYGVIRLAVAHARRMNARSELQHRRN